MQEIWIEGLGLVCSGEKAVLQGRALPLSHMEQELLLFLARNPNVTLTRERLLREVWGYASMGATRTIDSHIKKLRAHLGPLGKHIVTVRGQGYRLEPPPGRILSCCRADCEACGAAS